MDNVYDAKGNFMTDHVWMTNTEKMQSMNLQRGDRITFTAWVYKYRHSGPNGTLEYGLQRPGKIVVI